MQITSQQSIADVFGVTRETIDTWQNEGMPVKARGGPGVPSLYDSAACIAWRVESQVRKVQGERPQDRLARVQADKIEMENAVSRGVLIPADQLEPKLRAAIVAAREAWRNEPARLAHEAQGKPAQEMEDLLAAAFDAFLTRFARWPDAIAADEEEGG